MEPCGNLLKHNFAHDRRKSFASGLVQEQSRHCQNHPAGPVQPQRTAITYAKIETIRVPTLLMRGDQDLRMAALGHAATTSLYAGAKFIVLPEMACSIN